MAGSARPRGTNNARVIQVIETSSLRGRGTEDDPFRAVKQYWDFDGNPLAENDPYTKEKNWRITEMGTREILFRGKHIHAMSVNSHLDGMWVYGYLADKNYINSPELEGEFLVDEFTIGQYTGLTDKNGRKIFEGDIVSEDWGSFKAVVRFGEFESIVLKNIGFNLEWDDRVHYRQDLGYWADKSEVIGNIYDNPELMERG